MTLPKKYDELIELARECQSDTTRAELGFEARLMARIREHRQNGTSSIWDEAVSWVWRSAAGVAPLVAILLVWFFVSHGVDIDPSSGHALDFLGSYLNLSRF